MNDWAGPAFSLFHTPLGIGNPLTTKGTKVHKGFGPQIFLRDPSRSFVPLVAQGFEGCIVKLHHATTSASRQVAHRVRTMLLRLICNRLHPWPEACLGSQH
jgi:hypothetical protein